MKKIPETIYRYCWSLVYGKMTKGLPLLRKKTPSKKAQDRNDKI